MPFGNGIPTFSSITGVVSRREAAAWKTLADIKNVYRNASIVGNNRVVFNIKGNRYRLVVAVQYDYGIVYIRFVGSHQEYDKVDAATI